MIMNRTWSTLRKLALRKLWIGAVIAKTCVAAYNRGRNSGSMQVAGFGKWRRPASKADDETAR